MNRISIVIGALALGAIGAAITASSGFADDNAPSVAVTGGAVRGAMENGEAVFRGIPYVAPPVGDLRWKEPQPVKAWTGVKDATRFSPSCMQNFDFGPMNEDCLTLNIWTPEFPSKAPKAVMVWFHGGGDTDGGSNSEFFYGDSLAKKGVVVVSVNYRLGVFGFAALTELTAESPHHASGNYGLLDQIASLRWVQDNIAKFGGDPARVTIFGQSAGAADVERLLVSPLSKGLFARAIAESGAARRFDPPLDQQEKECAAILARLNPPAENKLAFLRRASATDILRASANVRGCAPINIDGYVLPEQPLKVFAESREHAVPFMLGNTLREGFDDGMTMDALKQAIAKQYGALAERAYPLYELTGARAPATDAKYGTPMIAWGTDQMHRCRAELQGVQHAPIAPFYQFQFERILPGQNALSSTHSDDVPFVFGIVFSPRYARSFNDADRKTSDQMQLYWTNFAKTGDPNGNGLPQWAKFDGDRRGYMAFGENGAAPGEGLRRAECDLFMEAEKARPTWQYPERGARW